MNPLIEGGSRVSPSDLATSYDLARVRKQLEQTKDFNDLPADAQEGIAQGIFASLGSFLTMSQAARWRGEPITAQFDLEKPTLKLRIEQLRRLGKINLLSGIAFGAAASNLLHLLKVPDLFSALWPVAFAFLAWKWTWRASEAARKKKP